MRISDWSSDVCSSDLSRLGRSRPARKTARSLRSSDSTATGHARECPAFHDRLIIGVDLSDSPAGSGRAGCRAELTVSLEGVTWGEKLPTSMSLHVGAGERR